MLQCHINNKKIEVPRERNHMRFQRCTMFLGGPYHDRDNPQLLEFSHGTGLTKLYSLTCYNYFVSLPEGYMHESTCSLYYRSAESGEGNDNVWKPVCLATIVKA
jgi:hypothetical protein